ncbi:MAG: PEP-CTERM sorting domain-containing protein [Phycisphaerae bacterium]|nr:PEP-CTERM sorting domain-containing protein [Phycisphaerae bacterium]
MKRKSNLFVYAVFCCVLFYVVSLASANPVTIVNDPSIGQDPLTISGEVEELGNKPAFPDDEWIGSGYEITSYRPCQINPDDQGIMNIAVSITNRTQKSWWDLHYVADAETMLQNYDINRLNGELAFKIDKTGLNTPLISESITANLIFEPGETWVFVIQDYVNARGLPASALGSLGVPSVGDMASSGSIIAIPEPATIILLTAGLLGVRRMKK